ncbi:unnamed protein product, partial [marine sediment metagenome]
RGELLGEGRKVFEIPHLNAGLSVAGSYSVNNISMNDWIDNFILDDLNRGNDSLENFSRRLNNRLESDMNVREKRNGLLIHIAGYQESGGLFHPEFWFVRNVHGIDDRTGEYININNTFDVTEDFWTRDCPQKNLLEGFNRGFYQMYGNGFASGRIGFFMLQNNLNRFFANIWNNNNWSFCPPQSLNHMEKLIKLYIQIIGILFEISNYPGTLIGGKVQTLAIPQPNHFVKQCT